MGNEYKSILENNNDKRKDLTDLVTITIDPDDAGDFDDAISVIKKDKGYYLFVHIADVSASAWLKNRHLSNSQPNIAFNFKLSVFSFMVSAKSY